MRVAHADSHCCVVSVSCGVVLVRLIVLVHVGSVDPETGARLYLQMNVAVKRAFWRCCDVVFTLSLPAKGMGRLRVGYAPLH